MLNAIASLTLLGLGLGVLLAFAARFLRVEGNPLVEEISALLPNAQCGQCGFPGCAQAAEAVADGSAPVTMCPPGGRALAEQLAEKLGVTLDLSQVSERVPSIAYIQEDTCIGCTRCYKVCPTDAIVGAAKQIHSVLADACTGCGNCVEVCPTECLHMQPITATVQTWHWPLPVAA